ncbi:MAG: HU family DNA-binding protein [Candidatus Caenarcaniphilales bacterium]|nr:HU family DNA-binding protein [Candidatus Caenarcaniphilales bacterium]
MNKTELIDKIAKQAKLEKTKVSAIVNSFLDVASEALSKHESITLIGFGTFKVRSRKARRGVNPQTGKKMIIPAAVVPAISFGDSLKKSVAKKKKLKTFATAVKESKPAAKKAAPKKTVVKKAAPKKVVKKATKKKR